MTLHAFKGLVTLVLGLVAPMAPPAHADQFQMAADNARVPCGVSRRELTRFSLVGDQFGALNKVSAGTPYNDFSVTHDPLRGDIYISVPDGFAPRTLTFFATSKKGYVYQFVCEVRDVESQQIFVTNPAIASGEARTWEEETPLRTTAVRLIQAMAANATVAGYQVSQPGSTSRQSGNLLLTLMAEYRGARLVGRAIRIQNRAVTATTLAEADLAPPGTLALTIERPELAPGEASMVFFVSEIGGQ
jgi:conjugal transfer pilus assembly protein TraK